MHYPVNTLDNKKLLAKIRARRMYFMILESAAFWIVIGYVVSTISMSYFLTDAFKQLDKVTVCK